MRILVDYGYEDLEVTTSIWLLHLRYLTQVLLIFTFHCSLIMILCRLLIAYIWRSRYYVVQDTFHVCICGHLTDGNTGFFFASTAEYLSILLSWWNLSYLRPKQNVSQHQPNITDTEWVVQQSTILLEGACWACSQGHILSATNAIMNFRALEVGDLAHHIVW